MADLCTSPLGNFTQKACGVDNAGIIGIGFTDPTLDFTDISDDAEWSAAIAASPQQAWIITNTRGEYGGGSPTESEGFGRDATQVTGADHEASFEVEGVSQDNVTFFNTLNQNRKLYFHFVTASDVLHTTPVVASVYATLVVDRDIKGIEIWKVTVKWQSLENMTIDEAPIGIFE
jgi:hypothetical protein